MSSKIDPRQVLSYLNQLGYKNIDAYQLQAFIKDLKKLIKYEERKSDEPEIIKLNILRTLNMETIDSTSDLNKMKLPISMCSSAVEIENSKTDIPERRPSTDPGSYVSSSKGKKKTNSILESTSNSTVACPVHFFRGIGCPETPRSKSVGTACTCPIDAHSQVSSSCIKDNKNKKGKRPVCSTLDSKIETNTTASYPNSFDEKTYYSRYCPTGKKTKKSAASRNYTHDFTHPCYCPGSLKPRSAVIKCNIDCKPPFPKCDPVNLHKYYQRQWKINKIPGENIPREQRFRWCFREKISCGPPVRLKKPLRKKYDIVLPIN